MPLYYIHNTTRSPLTRETRRSLPGPESSSKNLFLAGGLIRVVRGRPYPVTETIVRRCLAELMDKEKKGLLRVYNARSQLVDLRTLEPSKEQAPPPPSEPDDGFKEEMGTDADSPVAKASIPPEEEPPLVEEPPVEEPPTEEPPPVEEPPVEPPPNENPFHTEPTSAASPFLSNKNKKRFGR